MGCKTSMGRVARGNSAPWRMLRKLSLSESMASTSVSRASSIWRAAAWRVSKDATTSAPTWVWVRYLLQVGDLELGRPPAHDGEVGEAEVLEFPEKADLGVAPGSEVAEERIRRRRLTRPPRRSRTRSGRTGGAAPASAGWRPPRPGPVRWPARGGRAGPGSSRSSSGTSSGIRRMMHSGGSTGASTIFGSSTSRRTRLAEATSNWPLARLASRRRCFTSVSARRWSASRPCPRRA